MQILTYLITKQIQSLLYILIMSGGEGKEEMNENENKSSMEILSELFSKFDADPPVIIKKEKDESSRKHKKSKKKHKHKEKKHKKKSKKHKVRNSSESDSSNGSGIDLTDILKSEDCNSSLSETIKKIIKMDTKTMSKSNVKEVKEKEKKSHKRKKHKSNHSDDDRKKCKKMKFEEKSRKDSPERYKEHKRSIDRSESKYREEKYKYRDDYKYRDYRYKDDYRSKDYDDDKRHKYRDNPFYRDRSEDRYFDDRHRTYDRDRDKEDSDNYIDKKKLLEIARRNAIQMMKSGSLPGALTLGPQAQEKVIAAIRSGGKTVEELTDFCKTLSKQEELGELSSISDVNSSESDGDQPFHHPFQIKDKPLTINIKNSVPLPIKSNQERASELRIQFPVSSGQQHRKTESEWVPVEPKAIEAPPPVLPKPIPVEEPEVIAPAPVVVVPPGPQAFPSKDLDEATLQENVDIASIVSQRLTAMRKLQENPHDVQAITEMFQAQKEMNTWAESKQQVGQFTGSTGAQILSQAELSAGYQAWARKVRKLFFLVSLRSI